MNQLQPYQSYHPDLPVLVQRLQSAQIELQDIADEVDGSVIISIMIRKRLSN